MRTTQYIGLTDEARKYVEAFSIGKRPVLIGYGIGEEPVYGNEYELPVPEGPNTKFVLRETLQVSPWSSGPMLFTHLSGQLTKKDGSVVDMEPYFSWVLDPTVTDEYNPETGHYYV